MGGHTAGKLPFLFDHDYIRFQISPKTYKLFRNLFASERGNHLHRVTLAL